MSDSEPLELSVVLPACNEGPAVAEAVQRYLATLPILCPSFEIIVVDDGSTDDTSRFAGEAAAGDPRVRVLHHAVNQGQMAALLHGFRQARGTWVTHNGIDLPFDPADTGAVLQVL